MEKILERETTRKSSGFCIVKENEDMERIKMSKNIIAEKYTDDNGKFYIRLKYNGKHRTEVVMQESEFEKVYGKFD